MKTTFKSFIQEAPMNAGAYRISIDELDKDNLRIGFEVEMLIPTSSSVHVESSGIKDTPVIEVSDIGDIDDLLSGNYFDVSTSEKRRIEREYEDWVDEQKVEWIEDNWTNYEDDDIEDDDQRERLAREDAESQWKEYIPGKDKWLEEEYDGLLGFVYHWDLSPRYGWVDDNRRSGEVYETEHDDSDDYGDEDGTYDQLKNLWNREMDFRLKIGTPSFNQDEVWGVVRDGSLPNNKFYLGAELVSPPMNYSKAFERLEQVFDFMDGEAFETSDECGLHVGISFSKMIDNLDPLKLALFLGEKFSLEQFGRQNNINTQRLVGDIEKVIERQGIVPMSSLKDMREFGVKAIEKTKYRTANLSKLSSGYIEFRVMGGENYHQKLDDIKQSVGRFCTALHIACTPGMYQKEYDKKLYKVLDTVKTKLIDNSSEGGYGAAHWRELRNKPSMPLMEPFTNLFITGPQAYAFLPMADSLNAAFSKPHPAMDPAEVKYSTDMTWLRFVATIFAAADRIKTQVSAKQIIALKKIAKQLGIEPSEILADAELTNKINPDSNAYRQMKRVFK